MSVQAITAASAAIAAGTSGLSTGQCYDETPSDPMVQPPFLLHAIKEGTIDRGEGLGLRETTHVIDLMLAVASPGSDLATSEVRARPFVKKFIDRYDLNRTLAGTCFDSQIVGYRYGEIRLRPGEAGYLGIVFTLRAIEHETGVLYASTST